MVRTYHVHGTRTFLYWAIGLLLLGLWCAKDGWFPSEGVLLKHPIGTDTGFYLFNKVTAALALIASAVCGYIHWLVK